MRHAAGKPKGSPTAKQEDPVSGGRGTSGVVCLLQAVRLPGLHSKLVRTKVSEWDRNSFSYFEPSINLREKGVMMSEAADENGCIVVIMENHGCVPVKVEAGQALGEVQEAELCQVEEGQCGELLMAAVTSKTSPRNACNV